VTGVRVYGIRHHGPGSARRLLAAFAADPPTRILIELPSDATAHLHVANDPAVKPPVALIAYDGESSAAFPFVDWSPEWVAIRWAHTHGVPIQAIDRPQSAIPIARETSTEDGLASLARAAGATDIDTWWNATFETRHDHPLNVFVAIEHLIRSTRDEVTIDEDTLHREAWMRSGIAAAQAGNPDDAIAVICGAWHAPALRDAASDADLALVRGTRHHPVRYAWVPWSNRHMTRASGYGAGIHAPRWDAHVWRHGGDIRSVAAWISDTTRALRATSITGGEQIARDASPAQTIEAVTMTATLTALRNRETPDLADVRDATVATVMHGDASIWDALAPELLIGDDLGVVPPHASGSPLYADFERQATTLRLERTPASEWMADLREPLHRRRSAFLHRLLALGVDWGKPSRVSGALGTFKEHWILQWAPTHQATITQLTPLGDTVLEAATTVLTGRLNTTDLRAIIRVANEAVVANLPSVITAAVTAADAAAAATSDATLLVSGASQAAATAKVGNVRGTPTDGWRDLAFRLYLAAAYAWPAQTRTYDPSTARTAADTIDEAIPNLITLDDGRIPQEAWHDAWRTVARDPHAAPYASAYALRRTYDLNLIDPTQVAITLNRALSPARPFFEAAETFEGFFRNPATLLTNDPNLRRTLDEWLCELPESDLPAAIVAFRRTLSALTTLEKQAIWDALFTIQPNDTEPDENPDWDAHLQHLLRLIGGTE
jgi:hypothetical protein